MDDTLVKTNGNGGTGGSPMPHNHKIRATALRGGRGGSSNSFNPHSAHVHSKNKTWVSGTRKSASPAPEGRWERGRSFGGGAGGGRGRGRGTAHGVNGHFPSNSNSVFAAAGANVLNVTEGEYDDVSVAAGPSHRATPVAFPPPPSGNGTGKTWEELVKAREEERARAIREGKMDDPTKPKRLEEAITMVGTCQDMCPEFERYRRERENNLDRWECIVGPDGKPTKKVDHARAVKIYERGQGDKIIPSDLRPAPVLKRTLDYLFHDLIPRGGFAATQAFVRDRSRAVRNDFTIQQDSGRIAIECHERCTRFHILSLHLMYDTPKFDRALEMQQLMNSLLSLKEFYNDQRGNYESPNELEMRIYHRLGLIRDQLERNDQTPLHVASDPAFQLITRFRREVQVASSPITKTSKLKVSPVAMRTFGEFAHVLREQRNIVMIYLTACFLEHIFGKDTIDDIEGIKGSLSIQEIIDGYAEPEGEPYVEEVDGIEDADMDAEMVTEGDEEEQDELNAFIQEDEGAAGTVEEADSSQPGNAFALPPEQTMFQSKSAPEFPSSSSSSFGDPKAQSSFTPVPPSESVFGKIVSSSSTPTAFAKPGSSSVFGTTFNAFSPKSNIFGGAVFGVPAATSSPAPPKAVEIPKENVSVFPSQPSFSPQPSSSTSVPPSTSTILQETKPLRSLADTGPLLSGGKEDRAQPSEAIPTRKSPTPFPISQSAPVLNPFAPSFEPSHVKTSQTSASFPIASRSDLPPLRTDSPLSRIVDPSRGFVTPVDSPSHSFLSPPKPAARSMLSLDTGAALERYGEPSKHLSKSPATESPVAPPRLGRRAPISLPGTPTATVPSSSTLSVEPTTPSTQYSFPALRVKISSTTTGTPTPIPSSGSRVIEETSASPSPSPPSNVSTPLADGKSPKKPPPSPETKTRLREQAMAFRRRHGLVPEVFRRWKQRMLKTKEWKEACKRSEEYKQKIRESSTNGSISSLVSMPSSSSFKRQRSEAELVTEQPKRPRWSLHRMSNPSERRTDKDLEEILMKNHEKMERRWAKGQFVKAIQAYVRSRVDETPQNWATWLCMNASNDKTAIWLEKKFDVPESGTWASESVFSIPISTDPSAVFPGLIVFECTPLEEVDDEIEKKYRVLDDCARLRDVVSLLPENRHYSPSLIFINWDAGPGEDVHSDITDMAMKYVKDGLILSVTNVTMSSDGTDDVFTKCLEKVDVDLEGKYTTKLSLPDFFEHLSSSWEDAVKVWVEACSSDEVFNWLMFSHVVEHFVESLDSLLRVTLSAWNKKPVRAILITMPSFGVDRDESVLNVCYEWLRSFGVTIDQGDDPLQFFSDLLRIGLTYAQQFAKNPSQQRPVLYTTLEEISKQCGDALEDCQERLRVVVKTLPRPSPKRKANGASVNGRSPGESFLRASSPSPSGPKRARLSESFDSLAETVYTGDLTVSQETTTDQYDSFVAPGSPTPSVATSIATSVGNSSISASMSAKMLRELSRDVLKKYGKAKRKSIA